MARSILVVDPDTQFFQEKLSAAFPSLEVRTAASIEEAMPIADVDALGGMPRFMNAELVGKAKRLRWIQAFTTGVDHVLAYPTLKPDTAITSMRGIHGPQMAEMALLLMLAMARDLPRMVRNQQKALWQRFPQRRLYAKTVVIVGIGVIGEQLGPRCKALGMNVVGVSATPREAQGFDRIVPRSELAKVAGEADFLVLLVPYDETTDKLVDARVFAAMKPSACLVNIARGGVCDEAAMIEALRERRIAGAGLDVFQAEPLPAESPLWSMENVIVSPHEGGQCDVYNELVLEILQNNLRCFLDGRITDMKNLVRA